jgi:hypothetical protein
LDADRAPQLKASVRGSACLEIEQMQKLKYRMLLLAFTLILFGGTTLRSVAFPVAQDYLPVKTYGFVHWETTGITSGIVVNRKQIPIQFGVDSDALALRAFFALKWEVLAPNAAGRSIMVIGQLGTAPKFTPKCDHCAQSEQYREFRLIDWYITTPFKVAHWPENQLPFTVHINQQRELRRTDFHEFDGKDTMDLKRFQRQVRKIIHRASNKRLQRTRR